MRKIRRFIQKIPLVIPIYLFLKKALLLPGFFRDLLQYQSRAKKKIPTRFLFSFFSKSSSLSPHLLDKTSTTAFEPHYTYHPAWAARVIASLKPKKHIDISSILHFSTLVSAFVPVEFYDYRPAAVKLDNLTCKRGDLTQLPFADNSVESISCMHTIEHIGLGRYGDPIDPEGDRKAIDELKRVVMPGGTLICVVPIGTSRLVFNAHRIYSYDQIMSYFNGYDLKEFTLIPDNFRDGGMIKNATKEQSDEQKWGCGCFWFVKSQ